MSMHNTTDIKNFAGNKEKQYERIHFDIPYGHYNSE